MAGDPMRPTQLQIMPPAQVLPQSSIIPMPATTTSSVTAVIHHVPTGQQASSIINAPTQNVIGQQGTVQIVPVQQSGGQMVPVQQQAGQIIPVQ